MNVKGYAALAVKEDLVPHSFVRREGAGRNRLTWCCTVVVCRYHHRQVGQGSKVAVVGLGGLGHMAIKIAKALGADVTLFTRSPGKEADARRPGAVMLCFQQTANR